MDKRKKYLIRVPLFAGIDSIFGLLMAYFSIPNTKISNLIDVNLLIGFVAFDLLLLIAITDYIYDTGKWKLPIISFICIYIPIIIYSEILYIQGINIW